MKRTFTYLMLGACLVISVKSSAQLSETFESTTGTALPTGWTENSSTNPVTDSTNWKSGDNTTLASSGFMMNAHTRFCGVNDDSHAGAANTNELLISPAFNVPSGTPFLSFDCCYLHGTYGGFTEAGTVEASTDGGATWTVISTLAGNATFYWESRYISLSAYAGMSNVKLGFRYKDNGGWLYGFCIDNVNVFAPPAADLSLTSIAPMVGTPAAYGVVGGTTTMTGTVFNNGGSTVTSYTINYQFNGAAVVSNTVAASIAPFTSANFTDATPVALPSTLGSYPIRMWVSLAGDVNATNDSSVRDTLTTVSFMPTKKMVFEEATGSWCGYCVRGIIYMDSMWDMHKSDVSIVSIHDYNTYDPMATENSTTQAYDAFSGTLITGYPSMIVDRRYTNDPTNAFTDYNNDHADFGFADISMTTTVSGGAVTAAVSVKPAMNLTGDYRLELIITEDSVTGTSGGYAQHNYYGIGGSANSTPLSGAGYNFNDSAQVIPAGHIKFPFVDRWTIPNDLSTTPNGVAGSLPASMTSGSVYSYTFAPVTIASGWVRKNLRAVVFLIDNNTGSRTFGNILNSANTGSFPVGVTDVNAAIDGINVYPNPATSEAHITFNLKNSSSVQFTIYDMTGRVVFAVPAEQMNAGGQQINISTADLASGVYNVVITTDNGTVTERLSVVK